LRKGINALEYKPTVFIVSQRTSSIMQADKIVVLDDGVLVGLGKHENLLKSCEVYIEIYNSQYK
ncbi:MAG: ABC transporter ATP-binding protein, partial [Lachnospiraceae bacterium]|nr:ABC transporter ATP-binding protein [Lachnospiraceae bacterium]